MLEGRRSLTYRVCNRCLCGHLKREKGLVAPFPHITNLGSELHRQVQEDQPAERVVGLREGVPVTERRGGGHAAHDRRILVEDVVDAAPERERLVDLPCRGEVEV